MTAEDPTYHPGTLTPGKHFKVWRNQGWRLATCLATKGYRAADGSDASKALIEYEMPNGTTTLQIVPADGSDDRKGRSALPYKRVGKYWLEAMVAAGIEWIGNPQQSEGKEPIASPAGMLARYDQRAALRKDGRNAPRS